MLNDLGGILKAARAKKNLTLTELAQRCALEVTTIWRIEQGTCDPRLASQLAPLAEELGLNLSTLIRKLTPTRKGSTHAQNR